MPYSQPSNCLGYIHFIGSLRLLYLTIITLTNFYLELFYYTNYSSDIYPPITTPKQSYIVSLHYSDYADFFHYQEFSKNYFREMPKAFLCHLSHTLNPSGSVGFSLAKYQFWLLCNIHQLRIPAVDGAQC